MYIFKYLAGLFFIICLGCEPATAQASADGIVAPFPVQPQFAEGLPVLSVIILLEKEGRKVLADSLEQDAFYRAFQLRPGATFRQSLADLAITRINEESYIRDSNYELFNTSYGNPVILVVHVNFLNPGEMKSVAGKKGMTQTRSFKGFPVITETNKSKLTFILNGGAGLYNETNGLFSKGPEFTQGNPIADNPAVKGERFWGEMYIEPGIGGITRMGKSNSYVYGAASFLFSARNTTDLYSNSSAIYADFERLYGGLLFAKLGKHKNTILDVSYGRQFFQLNDAFLISKISGSANAGPRGSVYLSSRTAFQKAGLLKLQSGKWTVQGFYLEPEELFKDNQSNTAYGGGNVNFNNNEWLDAGLAYITTAGGTAKYNAPFGSFNKKGMYIINPKLWLKNIGKTDIFFKSEYAFQSHHAADMRSNAWYVGAGIYKKKWKFSPSMYYRYAYMQGDDSATTTFERFDPILTGGLGNWVQGIDFRKVVGNGNIISHRVELKANFTRTFEASLDYFFLMANSTANTGGLAPITKLNAKNYGQEITLTTRYFLNNHFLLLGVFSYAKPGDAITKAFADKVYPWMSYQAALFMFF